jgi:glycine/serine hydroxymethyltransferase
MTTRGFRKPEMQAIGELIVDTLTRGNDPQVICQVRDKVRQMCAAFPLYTQYNQESFEKHAKTE